VKKRVLVRICFTLVLIDGLLARQIDIPAGRFRMGRNGAVLQNQGPAFWVNLKAFRIDETLVTYAEFRRFVAETKYVTSAERIGYVLAAFEGMGEYEWKKLKGASWRAPFGKEREAAWPMHDDFPVTAISWQDADHYCRHYRRRLPTEAEWEYAARAKDGLRYAWGVEADASLGNYKDTKIGQTSAVGMFPAPNSLGLYDMSGNVWEWTSSRWGGKVGKPDFKYGQWQEQEPERNLLDPIEFRVVRGGSWLSTSDLVRCALRGRYHPLFRDLNIGFRVVLGE